MNMCPTLDVVGRLFDVGELKLTRNGSSYLDFQPMDDRNNNIKVTLWGTLAEQLLKRGENHAPVDVILLTAMNIREYKGGIQLSSTSGTIINDSLDIPEIFNLRWLMRTWYYNSCAERGCKKGLTPTGPQLWCESCEKICEFPLLRYRLRLVVSDETTSLVVTVFDEAAAAVVNKDVFVVMENYGEGDEVAEYPAEILQLVGTRHLFELKSHTYYNHGQYESFTVTRVISTPQLPPISIQFYCLPCSAKRASPISLWLQDTLEYDRPEGNGLPVAG